MRVLTLTLTAALLTSIACANGERAAVPAISDNEFWQIVTSFSEPEGVFEQPDNLVSNEILLPHIARLLTQRGGVYIGVGPEQNFSYIARIRPAMAFIVDIRNDNRNLHLLYKALFEMTADRADFVGRLFSRTRPPHIDGRTSVADLFAAIEDVRPASHLLEETKRLVRERLVQMHRFVLTEDDLRAVDEALDAFHADGPAIRYGRSLPPSSTRPSYRTLMASSDLRGIAQSFLASEDYFSYVKDLHTRNLIVPIVGDFAGAHALGRVGDYLRERGHIVSAFYGSNVEVYLSRDQRRTFCRNLERLPHHKGTSFIGSRRLQPLTSKLNACRTISPSLHWPK